MDMYTSMTPPSLSILTGSSSLTLPYKRSQSFIPESSLTRPLFSATSLDKEEVPTSTLPVKFSATSSLKLSLSELPELQKCSYSQSVLNGNGLSYVFLKCLFNFVCQLHIIFSILLGTSVIYLYWTSWKKSPVPSSPFSDQIIIKLQFAKVQMCWSFFFNLPMQQ